MSDLATITGFLENLGDPVLISNKDSEIVFANSACAELFGYTKDQMEKLRIDALMFDPGQVKHTKYVKQFISAHSEAKDMMTRNTIPCMGANGKSFNSRISISSVEIGRELYGVAIIQDYTSVYREITSLATNSNVDILTNLFNRRYLEEVLKSNSRILAAWKAIGVLYLDLNKFKPVNDTLGHAAGDSVLRMVANRLKVSVRFDDVVFRMGGDEFLILINLTDVDEKAILLNSIGGKIKKLISDPFQIKNQSVEIGVSVGAGIYPDDTDDIRELIHRADKAMYMSKKNSGTVNFVSELPGQ